MKYDRVWDDILSLEDHIITYMLYKEGKTVEAISKIRRMSKNDVERDIIKSKRELLINSNQKEDLLLKVISMPKKERIQYISDMNIEIKNQLSEDIYKRYIKFKNPEDRMILIWLIGELKDEKLIPILKMELSSKITNYRRLSCSALGKISRKETKDWVEEMLEDSNPQVRQYAAKALTYIGDEKTVEKLEQLYKFDEKEYVKRAAKISIEEIRKRNSSK